MNVNIALPVRLCVLRTKQIHFIISLGACRTDLQHGTHGGVAVDVGVVPLHVAGPGVDVGDLVDGLHQRGVGFSNAGAVGAVQNVCLGGGVEAVVHELLLYRILNGLNIGGGCCVFCLQIRLNSVGNPGRIGSIALAGGLQGFEYSGRDLALLVEHHTTVALDNALNHIVPSFSSGYHAEL